jgi:predicted ATPase
MMVDLMPPNALDHITIEGFKSIASIEKLPLRPINIVIGANGSGKSNFIGVFDFLHEIREGRLENYVTIAGGAEKVLHFGSKTTRQISVRLSIAGVPVGWKLHPTASDQLYLGWQEIAGLVRDPNPYTIARSVDEEATWKRYSALLDRPLEWRVYHFDDTSFSSPMRKTANIDDNRFLRQDGANLPAFLYLLREKHEGSYDLIVRTVGRRLQFQALCAFRRRARVRRFAFQRLHRAQPRYRPLRPGT